MPDITPKHHKVARHGTVLKSQPWAEVVEMWADLATAVPSLEPFHRFVRIMASYASSDLFAASLTHSNGPGSAFSNSADFHSADGVLEVRYFVVGGYFEFRTFCGHNTNDEVQTSEAVERLRLYLIYKYGVYLEAPVAKHAP